MKMYTDFDGYVVTIYNKIFAEAFNTMRTSNELKPLLQYTVKISGNFYIISTQITF